MGPTITEVEWGDDHQSPQKMQNLQKLFGNWWGVQNLQHKCDKMRFSCHDMRHKLHSYSLTRLPSWRDHSPHLHLLLDVLSLHPLSLVVEDIFLPSCPEMISQFLKFAGPCEVGVPTLRIFAFFSCQSKRYSSGYKYAFRTIRFSSLPSLTISRSLS